MMNRIAILILVLIVAALGILLLYRTATETAAGFNPAEVRRQPKAALQQVQTLLQQVRDGAAAAERARQTLNTIIENNPDSTTTMVARQRLAELEQIVGNHKAEREALLTALGSRPDAPDAPRLLMELANLSHWQLDQPEEALVTCQRLLSLYPHSDEAPEALLRVALLRRRLELDTAGESTGTLRRFSRQQPDHPLADEALFLAAILASDTGGRELERALLRELAERFPESPLAAAGSLHKTPSRTTPAGSLHGSAPQTDNQEADDDHHTEAH